MGFQVPFNCGEHENTINIKPAFTGNSMSSIAAEPQTFIRSFILFCDQSDQNGNS